MLGLEIPKGNQAVTLIWLLLGLIESSSCLFERILEVVKHELRPTMEKPLLTAISWMGWSLRESPGQANSVSQVMESEI